MKFFDYPQSFTLIIFIYTWKWQINIIKNTKKDPKKKHVTDVKIYLKKKKGERWINALERYWNIDEEENEKQCKSIEENINYYKE